MRILDVGSQTVPGGHATYIVSENVNGRTLADVVAAGPLPAETARRLVGEASQALARAAGRGLHHLLLGPTTVWVTPDGSVKIAGTAIEAAVAGLEPETSQAAERADAAGLVHLLYAALTGCWPGAGTTPLRAAPTVNGGVAPPGDLAAGIPSDLDTLCTVTLGAQDDGPRTPAEVAEQLAPWARSAQLTDPRGLSLGGPDRPSAGTAGRRPDPTADPADPAAPVSPAHPVSPVSPVSPTAPASRAASPRHPRRPSEPPGVLPAAERGGRRRPVPPAAPAAAAPAAAAAAAGGATQPGGQPSGQPSRPAAAPPSDRPAAQPSWPAAATAAPAPAAAPVATAGPAAATSTRTATPPGRSDLFTPATERARAAGAAHDDRPFGVVGTTAGGGPWTGLGRPHDGEEYLGPFLPAAPLTRPPQDQSQFVLVVVGAVVVLGLIIALWSLRDFGEPDRSPVVTPAPAASVTPTPSVSAAEPSATPSPTPTATPTPSVAAEIAGLRALDPLGDGEENDELVSRAADGDPDTAWRSSTYRTVEFGGLKDGLGIAVQLDRAAPVTEVRVSTGGEGSGGTVQLRTATEPAFDGSTVVAEGTIEDGKVVLRPAEPVTTEFLVVWVTRLPEVDGEGQMFVSEITVR